MGLISKMKDGPIALCFYCQFLFFNTLFVMFKFNIFLCFICLLSHLNSNAQDVKIGNISSSNSNNLVMENGVIVLSNASDTIAGAIRYENGLFYGCDGISWHLLSPIKKEILGFSNTSSHGRFEYAGKFGVEAANQMCKESYPNEPTARFYYSNDIDEALTNGLVNGITDGENFWAILHGFPLQTSSQGTQSNNCMCLSYDNGTLALGTKGNIFLNTPTPGYPNSNSIIANRVTYIEVTCYNNIFPVVCGK